MGCCMKTSGIERSNTAVNPVEQDLQSERSRLEKEIYSLMITGLFTPDDLLLVQQHVMKCIDLKEIADADPKLLKMCQLVEKLGDIIAKGLRV